MVTEWLQRIPLARGSFKFVLEMKRKRHFASTMSTCALCLCKMLAFQAVALPTTLPWWTKKYPCLEVVLQSSENSLSRKRADLHAK